MKRLPIILLVLVMGCGGKGRMGMKAPPPPKAPPAVPATRAVALDQALRETARNVIFDGFTSNRSLIRVHALEAAKQVTPDQTQAFINALGDKSRQVRFGALMAVGELKIADARPKVVKMLEDKDGRIRAGARYALHRLGDYSHSRDLEKLAQDPIPQVRAVTALVLGMLGEPTALNVLRPMQRDRNATVRLAVAEAMWRLGDVDGRDTLIGASVSRFPDDQMVATLALAATRDIRVRGHVHGNLTADHTEVQLVAARAMGQLGSDAGYTIAVRGAESKDPRQRSLAALALGAIGRADAQDVLRTLLDDADEDVQISAALAILQLKE